MAETTGIEWADATANFWIGCTKLSPACAHCYAEADWDLRKHRVEWGPHGDRSPVKAGAIVVRKIHRQATAFIAENGRNPRIFVNSLSDFADNHKSIKPEWREQVWQLARECPDVILMILTKRPQNLARYLPADWGDGYPNVWIGTTVENQEEADRRIPHLLATPAAVRWLSCEPLLGPVDLNRIREKFDGGLGVKWESALDGKRFSPWVGDDEDPMIPGFPKLDWVVVGGESGKDARPMHPDWARSLRDQCAAAGVPFFFKQWGEWGALGGPDGFWPHNTPSACRLLPDGTRHPRGRSMQRAGKKAAGRLLDSVLHDGMPNA